MAFSAASFDMKTALSIALALVSGAWADEAADRAAIAKTIAPVSAASLSQIAFLADSPAAAAELKAVSSGMPPIPRVRISHEPWGEALIFYPGAERIVFPIVTKAIRFVTAEVVLVDADWAEPDGMPMNKPILFVVRKVGNEWKIASARMLAAE